MKGILMAGGSGSRLSPMTRVVNKQLLPVYDKPMVYYPLSTLMLAGIREILVVTSPAHVEAYRALLGDGSEWGVRIEIVGQPRPGGIAEGLILGREFLAGGPAALVLGDNIFHGPGFAQRLQASAKLRRGAIVYAHEVADPERYGVVAFDQDGQPERIIEKPARAPSRFAVTGLYFYDGDAAAIAAGLTPSARGELEITDVNNDYLRRGALCVERLERGFAWLDTGTPESLLRAAEFVEALESRHGIKIGSPEEAAWRMGFIDRAQLARLAERAGENHYGRYIRRLASQDETAVSE